MITDESTSKHETKNNSSWMACYNVNNFQLYPLFYSNNKMLQCQKLTRQHDSPGLQSLKESRITCNLMHFQIFFFLADPLNMMSTRKKLAIPRIHKKQSINCWVLFTMFLSTDDYTVFFLITCSEQSPRWHLESENGSRHLIFLQDDGYGSVLQQIPERETREV